MAIKMAREAGPFFSVVDLCLVNKEMKHYFLGVGKKYLERTINVHRNSSTGKRLMDRRCRTKHHHATPTPRHPQLPQTRYGRYP
jgi:hypothetical protein